MDNDPFAPEPMFETTILNRFINPKKSSLTTESLLFYLKPFSCRNWLKKIFFNTSTKGWHKIDAYCYCSIRESGRFINYLARFMKIILIVHHHYYYTCIIMIFFYYNNTLCSSNKIARILESFFLCVVLPLLSIKTNWFLVFLEVFSTYAYSIVHIAGNHSSGKEKA